MQRSYIARTTVNFPDHELYVRVGDILVFDAVNGNNLTVYRGGSIVKSIKSTPIAIAAFVKCKMIEELSSKPTIAAPPAPSPAAKASSKPKAPVKAKSVEDAPPADQPKSTD